MNPQTLAGMRAGVDAIVEEALNNAKADGSPVPACKKGCLHCCKEPVYSFDAEVADIVGRLTPIDRAIYSARVRKWLEIMKPSGLLAQRYPQTKDYRLLNAWCPMLNREEGTCSIYEHRPIECRVFISSDAKACEDDGLREQAAVFGTCPAALDFVFRKTMEQVEKHGYVHHVDHFVVLLAKHLCGEKLVTGMTMEIKR